MLTRILSLSAALMLTAAVTTSSAATITFSAGQAMDKKDLQVFNDVAKSVNRYAHFTIFDDVSAQVKDGIVTLSGRVTMPYKREDIMNRVADVKGVLEVRDNIEVLPVSQSDDRLRAQIARAIYRNGNFANYAIGPNPSIHIIVEHGHVTLTGVVNNNTDRQIARSLITQFGVMSVHNDLKTDKEIKEAVERS